MSFCKFFYKVAVTLLMGVTASGSIGAQNLPLDYCSGYIASAGQGTIQGMTGNGATIAMAVEFPAQALEQYQGAKVTALRIGIPEATAYPEAIQLSLRAERDGQDLAAGQLTSITAGWLEAPLSTPYDVSGKQSLWVVASYVQASKLNVISFAGNTDLHACFLARDGRWTDFSSRNFGSLSLGMTLSGSSISVHDLAVTATLGGMRMARPQAEIPLQGTILNQGTSPVTNPVVQARIEGQLVGQSVVEGQLAFGQQMPYSLTLTLPAQVSTAGLEVSVSWPDGTADEQPADNTTSLPLVIHASAPYRVMVVEEGTGNWCGFCPRGIVGLTRMADQYPERFLGIAVHYNDELQPGEYGQYVYDGCNWGLPGALVNRDGLKRNPHPDSLAVYLDRQPIFSEMSFITAFWQDDDELHLEADLHFYLDQTGTDYRLAFVLLEDGVPAIQKNDYHDGSNGEMGGFESMPQYVQLKHHNVARGIYPSIDGAAGVIPANPRAGQAYHYELTVPIPATVVNREMLRLSVLLIDGTTGQIVQAHPTVYHDHQAISAIKADPSSSTPARDLYGRLTLAPAGFKILNGKIIYIQ